jgi:microcin C transport system ATP-binding protein
MTLLAVDTLSLTFSSPSGPVEAVKNVSLELHKGEMLALVGESGSGKSLTALSCLGLQPHSATVSGNIRFDGTDIVGAPEMLLRQIRGKRAAMIFQEPMTALNPLHTIERQIGEMLTIHQRLSPRETLARIHELLDQVGLSHFKERLDAYPHQLSGGERQRMMIAMAIANHPALLIADEPTTAVDVTIQAKILRLLKDLQRELGMAILFITHDLTVVRRLADRVAIMKQGEIVEQGKVAEVFAAPQHGYTQKLLASEPKGQAVPLPAAPQALIDCQDVKVHFPIRKGVLRRVAGHVKAVDGVSVAIPKGATLGLVGESGSGKTTLAFALLRLVKSEGKIAFLGKDLHATPPAGLRALRKQMQLVFQDPFSSLNPRMNIQQIVEEGLRVHFPDMDDKGRQDAVAGILAEVGLPANIAERFPHEFSGGQRQRISIARAMVLKPDFVVLDEPTSALDLTVQSQILDLLKSLQTKYGLSYLFISHDLRVIKSIAHHILVMQRGKTVEYTDTASLFAGPKTDYTKTLIDAAFLKG